MKKIQNPESGRPGRPVSHGPTAITPPRSTTGREAAGRSTLTRARSESAPVESQHRAVGGLSAAEKAEAVAAVRLEIEALRAELGLAC